MSDKKSPPFLDFNLLGRILKLAGPYKIAFSLSVILSIILALIGVVRPYIIIYTTDHYITAKPFDFEGLKRMTLWMMLSLIIEGPLRYLFNYVTAWLGQSIVKDVRIKVYDHIIHSRLQYFDTTPIGTSTTRTISDIEAINDTFSEGLIGIFADILSIIAVLTIMFSMNWKVAFASIAVLPVLLW